MVVEAVSLRVWSSSSAQTTVANYQSRSPILALDWVSPADSLVGHNQRRYTHSRERILNVQGN